jgi:acetoacetyl-CoA synthetase
MASALIENYRKAGLDVRETRDFSHVRLIFAGGSVLSKEAFHYAQEHLAPGTWLASCSGGTDILSCFICTNPWGPVWAGELQVPALGMDVQVFSEDGRRVTEEKGELVCCSPAPPMPLGFLDDHDDRRFHEAYFDRFPGIWAHGDFVKETEHGGFVIYGRSDSVLNHGGVRIGTAEIYRQLALVEEVADAVVVGLEREDDVVIALYVMLADDLSLDASLVDKIKTTIRSHASPRHVPKIVNQVPDIPRTRSGKTAESAVREAVNGRPVKQVEALANPGALDYFTRRAFL